MPAKNKKKESVSSEGEEIEYDSEEQDEEMSSGDELGNAEMREVDQNNLLNYQTDSEDDDEGEDSNDLDANLEKQKEELQMNEAWGKHKRNYYKSDSDSDEGSEDDQELAREALRLQSIRQKKLAKQLAAREDSEDGSDGEAQANAAGKEAQMESEDDLSSDEEGKAKLGDKLFQSNDQEQEEVKKAAELNAMNPELVKKIIESDSPELQGLLEEFQEALSQANEKLLPFLTAARAGKIKSTASGMSYLEMKYNLLMSYCTFLAFYLLLKVEGKPVDNHPVIHKLTHIKTLFEKLKPLDQKLQYQVDKMANMTESAAQGSLSHKPNLKDLEMVSDEDDDIDEDEVNGSDEGLSGEEEVEDEMDDEDGESDIEDDMRGEVQSREESEEKGGKRGRVVDKGGVYKAPKLNAVTFEDAKERKQRQKDEFQRKRLGKTSLVEELKREMADAPEEVYMGGVAKKGKVARFQDALEREEMEAFKRVSMTTKEKKALRNRNFDEMQDKLDTLDDDFAAIQSIVRRTGSKAKDEALQSAEKDAASSKFSKSLKQFIEKPKKQRKIDQEKIKRIEAENKEKSRKREEKAARKLAAQKEFQESKLKEVKGINSDITRNITYDILKAKGITRKRKKDEKNPRVKKRMQYEKLVKKHKTKVQEYQDGKPQGLYQGETQGLRTGVVKSTKIR